MTTRVNKTTAKPIAKRKRGNTIYHLFANGELWTTGRYAYLCGYVMDAENIDYAIANHEEEMRCLREAERVEFRL